MVPVSSRETTLLDVANDIGIAGGIDNAANLIIELCEATAPDTDILAALSAHYPVTTARRLGFLLEKFTDISGLEKLEAAYTKCNTAPSLLDPQAGRKGAFNARWNIIVNREVNPDV